MFGRKSKEAKIAARVAALPKARLTPGVVVPIEHDEAPAAPQAWENSDHRSANR